MGDLAGLARSATYAAAAVLQEPGDDDPIRAASAAKLLAADAADAATEHTLGEGDGHAAALGARLVAAHR